MDLVACDSVLAPAVPFGREVEEDGLESIERLSGFLPTELWNHRELFFYEGMRLEIGPCFRDYAPPEFFREATRRAAGRASLLENGGLAAEGAGLGIRFLKHLRRTRVLLHLVDVLPPGEEDDPVADCKAIVNELERFSPELAARERWLVLNKTDLLDADQLAALRARFVDEFGWTGPMYEISALTGAGTRELVGDLMTRLEELDAAAAAAD